MLRSGHRYQWKHLIQSWHTQESCIVSKFVSQTEDTSAFRCAVPNGAIKRLRLQWLLGHKVAKLSRYAVTSLRCAPSARWVLGTLRLNLWDTPPWRGVLPWDVLTRAMSCALQGERVRPRFYSRSQVCSDSLWWPHEGGADRAVSPADPADASASQWEYALGNA